MTSHRRLAATHLGAALLGMTLLAGCSPAPPPPMRPASPPAVPIVTATPPDASPTPTPTASPVPSRLAISAMRAKAYPGSDIIIERTLPAGPNHKRYVVSYLSDGLRLYGLLTVPTGDAPAGGWPVILMNHGYILPTQYSTVESYAGIVAPLAAAGYIVFKPDYRGHGKSPGAPYRVYVSPAYVTDSLNALASIRRYPDADPAKVGVWGHSMGGNITLHELVLTRDLQAAVIAAGVVGSYGSILDWWAERFAAGGFTTPHDVETRRLLRHMVITHGTPHTNPDFWDALDPTTFTADIDAPVLIQVGSADVVVPPEFSQSLADRLQEAGKRVTYHVYPGADHNLAPAADAALAEAIAFFDEHLNQ